MYKFNRALIWNSSLRALAKQSSSVFQLKISLDYFSFATLWVAKTTISSLFLKMAKIQLMTGFIILSTLNSPVYADCVGNCCALMGGIRYCDSSAGRYVCNNGDYSACYCTRHAIMDLQKIMGCCLWQGGVLKVTETGVVICNNGSISEICSLQSPKEKVAVF